MVPPTTNDVAITPRMLITLSNAWVRESAWSQASKWRLPSEYI